MDRIERGFVNRLALMPDLSVIMMIGEDFFNYQCEVKEDDEYFERISGETGDD